MRLPASRANGSSAPAWARPNEPPPNRDPPCSDALAAATPSTCRAGPATSRGPRVGGSVRTRSSGATERNRTRSPEASQAGGSRCGSNRGASVRPSTHVRASEHPAGAGRGRRVQPAAVGADRDRAGRKPAAGTFAARRPQLVRQTGEIGESGRIAEERHGRLVARVQTGDFVEAAPQGRFELGHVGAEPVGDRHRPADGFAGGGRGALGAREPGAQRSGVQRRSVLDQDAGLARHQLADLGRRHRLQAVAQVGDGVRHLRTGVDLELEEARVRAGAPEDHGEGPRDGRAPRGRSGAVGRVASDTWHSVRRDRSRPDPAGPAGARR